MGGFWGETRVGVMWGWGMPQWEYRAFIVGQPEPKKLRLIFVSYLVLIIFTRLITFKSFTKLSLV